MKTTEPFDMIFLKADGTGVCIDYYHPENVKLTLDDFKIPTSNICRYNGTLDWKLIKHLALGILLCYERFGDNVSRANISGYYAMHDLHECIVGDVVSGMKPLLPEYRKIEEIWEQHVHNEMGMSLSGSKRPDLVRVLDLLSLVVEMQCLGHPGLDFVKSKTDLRPTPADLKCFYETSYMTDLECWDLITKAIAITKSELTWPKTQQVSPL